MDNSWLDLYPPEDKDSEIDDQDRRPMNPKRMKVENTIDLHGYRLEDALVATRTFVDASVREGHRKVLIVHGKGENGSGVIKREVRAMLEQDPRTGQMGYAKGSQGGTGALWVMLREEDAPLDENEHQETEAEE